MPDSSVTLADIVYRLREQLASLQCAVNNLIAAGSEHEHPGLMLELQALAEIVRGHVAAEEERLAAQAAPVWVGLDEEEYRAQLGRVTQFVDHLRVAYPGYWGDILRDCWPAHSEVLWELGNLCAEWHRTYDRERPSLDGALTWHDRWQPGVRARLQPVMRNCRGGHCSLRTGARR